MNSRRLLLTACAALAPLALSFPAAATVTSPDQVDHWGSYFGDHVGADRGLILTPAPLAFGAPVVQVGTSNSTQYALLADGTLWAWGQGTNGELGNGSRANSFTVPVQVQFPPGVLIASIPSDAMPYDTGLAVDTSGNAWGWGLNLKGELCLGNTTAYDTPQELPLAAPVTTLAGANSHAVYDSAGTVYACGSNYEGLLGTGKTTPALSTVPVAVQGLPAGVAVSRLVSAYANAGALLADGTYWDWGYDAAGQLGNGTVNKPSAVPVKVTLPAAAAQVSQGGSNAANGQTLVMLAGGSLYAWGADAAYQLGDGKTAAEPSPVPFAPPAGVTYAQLASGGGTSYAIDTTGAVWAWGDGTQGQIGNGGRTVVKVPVQVDSGAVIISSTAHDVEVAG